MKTWLANSLHSWLLIIDNADDPNIDYAAFFPSGNKGGILLTTRNPQCRDHETVGSEDLDSLGLQDGQSLLFKAAEIAAPSHEGNQKAAEHIIQVLGFHTLAIIQAGSFIKRHRCSLEEYPALFRKQEEHILKYCLTQEQSTYGSVFATFEISATHLKSSQEQSATDALSLLQILGFIHFQEIPESMFLRAREEAFAIHETTRGEGPHDEIYNLSKLQTTRLPSFMIHKNDIATDTFLWRWRETLTLLESYSFVKIIGSGQDLSFSMHPLVHTWTRIRQNPTSRKEGWRTAGSIIALSMQREHYNMFHEKLRSHAGSYLDYLIGEGRKSLQTRNEYLADMTELEICQTHYRICYLFAYMNNIFKLRFLLDMLGNYKIWADARRTPGSIVQSLAATYLIKEGQPHEAVKLLERLLNTKHINPSIPSILATAYIASNQYEKAISLLEKMVRIEEKTKHADNAFLYRLQHDLGRAYLESGQYDKAVTLFERLVKIEEQTMAPVHPDRLTSEHSLGKAYITTHQYEEAAKILQKVLETRRQVLEITNPHLLGTQHELARTYLGMGGGHYEKAVRLLEQVVEIQKKTLAPDNTNRLASQHNLALAYNSMGNGHYGKAAGLLEQVVAIREKILASDDPYLLNSQQLLEEVQEHIKAEEHAESTSVPGEEV